MNEKFIQQSIEKYIREHSGLDQDRDYLGISKIPLCPRQAILEYRNGPQINYTSHRMCYAGYAQEADVMDILANVKIAGWLPNNEVVAPFDERLRGHVDGITVDDELLEIKSVSVNKFKMVNERNWALRNHFIQVQLYMRYGGWQDCYIVYRCQETYEHQVVHVKYSERQSEKFEEKAKMLLKHIDTGTLPDCECGRHND